MATMDLTTAKKINLIIKEKGLTVEQVKNKLEKINGYVSLDFFKSLKFDFSNESTEISLAVLNFYIWMHGDEFKNPVWFTPAYRNDMISKVNEKISLIN